MTWASDHPREASTTMYTVFSMFAATADAASFRPFLCIPERHDRAYFPDGIELSYGEIGRQVCTLRDRYRASGFGHGHRACLLLENRPDFIVHWLALNSIGVSIVPINPAYRAAEIEYLIAHAEPDLIVTLHNQKELLKALTEAVPLLAVSGDDLGASVLRIPPARRYAAALRKPRKPYRGRAALHLWYDSAPEGLHSTNEYVVTTGRWYASRGGRRPIIPGPIAFTARCLFSIWPALTLTTMAMMLDRWLPDPAGGFNARYAWRDIVTCRATVLHYLGVIVAAFCSPSPDAGRKKPCAALFDGVGANPEQRSRASERFGIPFVEGWGMTETGEAPFNTVEPRHPETKTIGRASRLRDDRRRTMTTMKRLRGRSANSAFADSAATPRGFLLRIPGKISEATEHAWRGGWSHTGDSVWQHDDGAFVFVDRLKHLVRRAGENISAAEIEGVLTTSALRQASRGRCSTRSNPRGGGRGIYRGVRRSRRIARWRGRYSVSAVNAWRRSSCRRGSPSSANCR